MRSQYKTTIIIPLVVVVYLLFCLFITTSASARSEFIREVTDDGFNNNTDLQQEISSTSGDYNKVSSANSNAVVKGVRELAPSSYSLKMESFNMLLNSTSEEGYVTRPFTVGGYNWRLVVYPNGNKNDNGTGYLSLYVAIDNSALVAGRKEVYADVRFYVFNNNTRKYFTIQDTVVWKFSASKTMWGFSHVLSIDAFKDPKNGYLYDGDHCEFGVDVSVPSRFEKSELFTVTEKFDNPRFTWNISGFSTLERDYYISDEFIIGGRNWFIQVYPNGGGTGLGKSLAMYLYLESSLRLRPYEKIYVQAKLRVLNQRELSNVETQLGSWYSRRYDAWGRIQLIPLSDLKDPSKGFVVNDVLMVQVEIEALSSTKYLPS